MESPFAYRDLFPYHTFFLPLAMMHLSLLPEFSGTKRQPRWLVSNETKQVKMSIWLKRRRRHSFLASIHPFRHLHISWFASEFPVLETSKRVILINGETSRSSTHPAPQQTEHPSPTSLESESSEVKPPARVLPKREPPQPGYVSFFPECLSEAQDL